MFVFEKIELCGGTSTPTTLGMEHNDHGEWMPKISVCKNLVALTITNVVNTPVSIHNSYTMYLVNTGID